MAYEDMLTNTCRVLSRERTEGDETDDNDWGYESKVRTVRYYPGGEWFNCYYTDKSGTEVINFAGSDVRVTTEIDVTTERGKTIGGDDRIELDDGRIVDVLNVLIMAGGFKAKIKCGSKSGILAI